MSALRAGIPMRAYWEMTPAETFETLEGAGSREDLAQNRLAWAVWHVAALQRQKRLPSLSRLLRKEPVQLTPKQMAARREEHAAMAQRWRESRGQRQKGDD